MALLMHKYIVKEASRKGFSNVRILDVEVKYTSIIDLASGKISFDNAVTWTEIKVEE